MTKIPVTFADVEAARARIGDAILNTPCPESAALSDLCGCRIFCKLEYLQRTGSFKERGACNALLALSEDQSRRGVIAASAGNHALALACHGRRLGIPVTVVMPRFAPLIKQQRCRQQDADVVLHGDSFGDARAKASEIATERGLTYVHGYDDPHVIAGQGTLGLELMEHVPSASAVVIPIGGGGLIAGVALAIKALRPDIELIGVEALHAPCYTSAIEKGEPCETPMQPTLADGLAVGKIGENAFAIARQHIDRVVQVDEAALALAVVRLMELEKSVVEGAGAASLAALLTGELSHLAGKDVVLCLCGGNIDLSILNRLIETALVHDGRLARFTATISDRPGGLARLAQLIADCGASVHEITHDRAFAGPNMTSVNVLCTVETHDHPHIQELYRVLADAGIDCWQASYGSSRQRSK